MYPFVTHTWNPIRGCAYCCKYCYVKSLRGYDMTPRLVEKEFKTPLGSGNFIFVGSTSDMFGDFIEDAWIQRVLEYCNNFDNTYLFQSKNPKRFRDFKNLFPKKTYLATTIESNVDYNVSKSPAPLSRALWFRGLSIPGVKKMVSIEPVLDFNPTTLLNVIRGIDPVLVTIGADSKHHKYLREPNPDKVKLLIKDLRTFTKVIVKGNLKRLIGE